MFFVHFWRCMRCFWINSNPYGNLEESAVGPLIKDIFFITFLESGRVDFPMVSFGRDMQKSAEISAKILQAEFCSDSVLQWFMPTLYNTRRALQHFRFHFCIQRCAEISVEVLHSEFCRVLQKSILRSSAEKPSEGKLCGVFADNFAEVSSGFLHAWSYKDCMRIYTRRSQ